MKNQKQRLYAAGLRALPLLPLLLASLDAWARAGGGESYRGGGGSSSSSGGSSGGGGDLGSFIQLLLWLVIEVPIIGIPLVIAVVAFFIYAQVKGPKANARQVHRTTHAPPPAAFHQGQDALVQADPNFSLPLFLDYARLAYMRAQEERGKRNLDVLSAILSDEARKNLEGRHAHLRGVRGVVFGAARVEEIGVVGGMARIVVFFDANYTEVSDQPRTLWLQERWIFRRSAATRSPGPDRFETLSCANCGSPLETKTDGTCVNCGSVLNDGRIQWQVAQIQIINSKLMPPLKPSLGAGIEAGTELPTMMDPDLGAATRAFQARHPEFHWTAFRGRVVEIFTHIQRAWSDGTWEKARPYETDFLFQQHRYWIDRYKAEGYRNRMADLQVTDVLLVKIKLDAYFEAVTVRIFVKMKDWTEDKSGKVVGGSKEKDKIFSEYWTFLRSAGQNVKPRDDANNCPSCGAPLDNVSEGGVCGYCDAKITTGAFDWVLSAIDQDEAYRG